jgi:hypothetical protein
MIRYSQWGPDYGTYVQVEDNLFRLVPRRDGTVFESETEALAVLKENVPDNIDRQFYEVVYG